MIQLSTQEIQKKMYIQIFRVNRSSAMSMFLNKKSTNGYYAEYVKSMLFI